MQKPRRFYKAAAAEPVEGGFAVALDGRVAKTPAGRRLILPTAALAELIAAEWAAQGEVIDMGSMGATRLAFTALDRTAEARDAMAQEVARYAGSDLLCYFAEGPQALLEREASHWGPVLDWAQASLQLQFVRAWGVVHQPQPTQTIAQCEALARALDDMALTGLAFAAGLFGSAILAFAVHRGVLSGDAAFDLSRLDDAYQQERWGVDAEAAERTARLRGEAALVQRWFSALRPSPEVPGSV